MGISPQSLASPRNVDLTTLNFLIIDDSRYARTLIKHALTQFKMRNSIEAADAASGLRIMESEKIDVVLVDKEMPSISGTQFTQLIRRGDFKVPNPELPIIMISGHTDRDTVVEALSAGINDFLAKPVSAEALFNRIQANICAPRRFVRTKDYIGPERRVVRKEG